MSDSSHSPVLKHHFDNLEQQHSAERLGMWMFLVTEVLFFSGLFVAYSMYRMRYPEEFKLASSHLILWVAAVNTVLLITSSLTMTFAIRCAQLGDRSGLIRNLLITAILGTGFMGFKAYEYAIGVDQMGRGLPEPPGEGAGPLAVPPVPAPAGPMHKETHVVG